MPAILNAANEVAVQAFLDRQLNFLDIPRVIEAVITSMSAGSIGSLDDVLAADAEARRRAIPVRNVVCTVSLTPIDDRSVQLVVLWMLKDPGGKEVGKVEQSNAVPTSATRGTWAGFGDIVADAAVEGILQLLDKALAKQP